MSVSCLTIIVIGISILFELSKQTFNDYCSIFAYPKVFSLGSHILKKEDQLTFVYISFIKCNILIDIC